MLVDDDAGLIEVSKEILEAEGNFKVDSVCCVDEAFKKLSTGQYDVVVSDYMMPQKDGLQFLKELREQNNKIPFILFTGKGREEVAMMALNLGADGYFHKQGSPKTVYGELAHALFSVTEKKAIQAALTQSRNAERVTFEGREYAENIMATMRESLLVLDDNFKVVSANDSFYRIFEATSKETEGNCIYDLGDGQWDIPKLHDLLEKIIPTKSFFADFEVEHDFPKIGHRTMLLNARQILQRVKGASLILVAFEDITERKKADLVVFDAREYAENIMATMRESLLVLDDNFKVVSANDSFYRIFEATSKETEGNCIYDLGDGQWDIPKLHDLLEKIIPTKSFFADFEVEHDFPKIGHRTMLLNARQILQRVKGASLILVAFEDITERKKAEDENSLLHSLSERVKELNCIFYMSKIFEKSDIPLDEAMAETVKLLPVAAQYSDIACAKIVVRTQEFSTENFKDSPWKLQTDIKVLGEKIGFAEIVYLEEKPIAGEGPFLKEERNLLDLVAERLGKILEHREAVEMLLESQHLVAESGRIGKVGGWIINVDTNKLTWTDETYHIHEVDHTFKPSIENMLGFYTSESRIIIEQAIQQAIAHGKSFDLELQITTAKGNIRGLRIIGEANIANRVVQGVFQDITERKKTEETLKENYAKIDLMNEKLHVVGGLTRHDARNKLGVIVGQVFLLNQKYVDSQDLSARLRKIEVACQNIEAIFDFAKVYEQLDVEELTCVDVGQCVDAAVALFQGLTIKIVNDCHGKSVLADSFLRQLFYSFIDNSRKYAQKATTIKVYYEQEDSGGLRIIYEDDGVGISAENKPKLFKEGFSTGGSTGYGLFLVKKLIEVYGWTITEEGEPGKGAKFIITIPEKSDCLLVPNGKNQL